MTYTNFPDGITSFGVPTFGVGGLLPFNGRYFFVDPVTGSDGNTGGAEDPLASIGQALSLATAGNNDVIFLVGDGSTAATNRLTANLAWNKRATHLIGLTAPTQTAQRARIAPPTAGTAFANFITVSVQGCIFANFSVFNGFATGTTSQIAWTDTGGRNYYSNVCIEGMGDAASAASAGSRSLLISGTTGENTFVNCQIGTDTISRGAANASVEFAGGTPRNRFLNCLFPFQASASTPLGFIGTGAANMDRWQLFQDCSFINNVQSTATTMAGLGTLAASAGGLLLFKNSTLVGITEFGTDATTRGQCYVDGAAPTAGTSGIAVNPT